jgi:hypothetical protein
MEKQIPIMLDTSIYKQVPKLNSQLFLQLIKYSRAGHLKLYISEIIENEYLTWIRHETQEAYSKVVHATESLDKYYEVPDLFGMKMNYNITANVAHSHISRILEKVIANWKEFKKQTNATLLPIREAHGKLVMDAYFAGNVPFRDVKSRVDIPDAFIYFSIIDILKKEDRLIFVSQDKEFLKRIAQELIIPFESLPDVFSCAEYSISERYLAELEPNERAVFVFQYFKMEILKKAGRQIEIKADTSEIDQDSMDKLIGEYKGISINAESIDLDQNGLRSISDLSFILPISGKLVHSISSVASNADLSYADEARVSSLAKKDVNDDGLFDITENRSIDYSGNISISFADSNPLSWKETVIENSIFSEVEIAEIKVAIESLKIRT